MKIRTILIVICILFISILTVGCIEEHQTEEEKLVGVWLPEEELYKSKRFEFLENGTCYFRTYKYKGTYEVNETEKKLTVHIDKLGKTYVYTYKLIYDKLTLTNEDTFDTIVYLKQE